VTDLLLKNTSLAYVNYGRWVADCSSLWCDAAVEFNSLRPPHFATFTPATVCWECGHRTEILWPSQEMVYGIERLLLLRRNRKHQNWLPGETLVDLQEENGLHGVFDFLHGLQLECTPGTSLMGLTETAITTDGLPMLNPRRALKAVER
jgi:hypothetical protein